MHTRATLVGCSIAVLVASAWLLPQALSAGDRSPAALMKRIRMIQLVTPFDEEKLARGEESYSPRVILKAQTAKVHVRTERAYAGPMPTTEDLRFYLREGVADAFYRCLRGPQKLATAQRLRPVEAELGRLASEIDVAMDSAKVALHGTPDEIVLKTTESTYEVRQRELQREGNAADRTRLLVVNISSTDENRWFRIRKERFPRLFDLRAAQTQTTELRQRFLEGQLRDLLETQGVEALDPNTFPGRD